MILQVTLYHGFLLASLVSSLRFLWMNFGFVFPWLISEIGKAQYLFYHISLENWKQNNSILLEMEIIIIFPRTMAPQILQWSGLHPDAAREKGSFEKWNTMRCWRLFQTLWIPWGSSSWVKSKKRPGCLSEESYLSPGFSGFPFKREKNLTHGIYFISLLWTRSMFWTILISFHLEYNRHLRNIYINFWFSLGL